MYDISYKRALKIASSVREGPRVAKNLTYSETSLKFIRAFLWNIRCYFKAFSECKGCFFLIHSLLQAKTCKEACVFGKEPLKEPDICSKISPSRKCQREQTYSQREQTYSQREQTYSQREQTYSQREQTYRGVLRRSLYVWHRDKEKEPQKVP